ncbi:hypothetical protein DRN98_08530 [Methanosarcinales archaeon]|nr:MAG: hypothetical protein DRN98_08530 [Methanosarcinales archaeon]
MSGAHGILTYSGENNIYDNTVDSNYEGIYMCFSS